MIGFIFDRFSNTEGFKADQSHVLIYVWVRYEMCDAIIDKEVYIFRNTITLALDEMTCGFQREDFIQDLNCHPLYPHFNFVL